MTKIVCKLVQKLSLFEAGLSNAYGFGTLLHCLTSLQVLASALKVFNYFFTAVFILEAGMKIAALGCGRYLNDRSEIHREITCCALPCCAAWDEASYGQMKILIMNFLAITESKQASFALFV